MDHPHLQRALMLIETSRWELAERELRQALVTQPNQAMPHALLALCLAERKRFDEATQEAEQAIYLAPDTAFPHYVYADVMLDRNRFAEAENAVQQAIMLDPSDANYYGKLSQIYFAQRRWPAALQAADQGLQLDPEDDLCVNLRAMSLLKLGRKASAEQTIGSALARDPDNAATHANLGWTLIERSDHQQALHHFREALRIDPGLEFAQAGIVEALKSRNIIYRLMLGYFLWISKLSSGAQWGILVGAYVLFRIVRNAARNNPELASFLIPIMILYGLFAVMTWMAVPLFNLMLRLNKFGRMALGREQIRTSNWVGICLLAGIGFLIAYFVQGESNWLIDAICCALLLPPLSTILSCEKGWPRNWMLGITAALLAGFALMFGLQILSMLLPGDAALLTKGLASLILLPYFLTGFATQFAANYFVSAVPRR